MPLACAREADLADTDNRRFAADRELGAAIQDNKHFMAEVVGVAVAHLARLEAHDARSNLRRDEEIAEVRPRVEDLKCHARSPPHAGGTSAQCHPPTECLLPLHDLA